MDNFEQQILFTDILPTVSEISARKKKLEANLPPDLPAYRVIRKERRRRSVSAYRQGGVIEIHIPAKMSRRQEIEIIPEMISLVCSKAHNLKSEIPGRSFLICLPLADMKQLSEDFVALTYVNQR